MAQNEKNIKAIAEKYLRGDINEDEKKALFSWMRNDDMLWILLKNDIEGEDAEMNSDQQTLCYNKIVSSENIHSKRRAERIMLWNRVLTAACMVFVVIAGALAWNLLANEDMDNNPFTVMTKAGDRSNITLPDGTKVSMNTLSTLTYHFDNNTGERIVNLEGEGYFQVAADKEHPFRVLTNGMNVLCLGTKFDVKNYDEDDNGYVILREGSVKVTSGDTEMMMKPGSCVNYNKATGLLTKTNVQKERSTDWIDGDIYYTNESLGNITKQLARNYGVRIIITNPELSNETFTGYLSDTSLNSILNTLVKASGINYEFVNDTTVHIYER